MLKDTVQKLGRITIETETKQASLSWKLGHIMCSVLNDKKSQKQFLSLYLIEKWEKN